jgi:hypothetical protein
MLWYSGASFISSLVLVSVRSTGIYFHSRISSQSFSGIGTRKILPSLNIQYGFSFHLGLVSSFSLSYKLVSYKGISFQSKKAFNTSFIQVVSSHG